MSTFFNPGARFRRMNLIFPAAEIGVQCNSVTTGSSRTQDGTVLETVSCWLDRT